MNKENNKKVVREFYEEIFRKHDLSVLDRFMHDNYIQHNPDVRQGKTGFVDFHKGFFAAIPDSCATINRIVAEAISYLYITQSRALMPARAFLGIHQRAIG